MSGQLQMGVPFVQLMHRYRAIAPRPLAGKAPKAEVSSKTPQESGSSCGDRETEKARTSQKRVAEAGDRPAKKSKRVDVHVSSNKPFELPTPISLPMTQPIRIAAGPVETRNARYGFNSVPFSHHPRPAHTAQTYFPPAPYPASSLNRYRSAASAPSLPVQQFPPYSQLGGGTVLGVPVHRSSLSEQVVPVNHFSSHQQHSNPSDGTITTGNFTPPPRVVVTPPSPITQEKPLLKPKPLVAIAPKTEAGKSAGPFPRVHAAGALRGFGTWQIPQKGATAGPGLFRPICAARASQEGPDAAESKPVGLGSGFRRFHRNPQAREGTRKEEDQSNHRPAVLDSTYLEQLYGAFVEPVMVTDEAHRLLWSNAAFQKVADENQKATQKRDGSAEPGQKSGVTAEEGGQRRESPEPTPTPLSNIPVPISSIHFRSSLEATSCTAILWVFLKQSGLLPSVEPPNPPAVAKPNQVSPALSLAPDACSPLESPADLFSKGDDSSSASSSSNSFATASSKDHSGQTSGAPARVVTPQPLRLVRSTIHFKHMKPLASTASLAVKGSFELIKRQFDQWATPVILTDLKNRARWVNYAYKSLVGQAPPGTLMALCSSDQLRVLGGINIAGLDNLKTLPPSLECTATVSSGPGSVQQSSCVGTRIDSVGSEVLGYLWRFDALLRRQPASDERAKLANDGSAHCV